ncbi:hypothetical protein PG993_009248 [Apiospora rasikravindrae]|uniref:Killer toxin Kp4 domain-containing protein n=1 Tax=Apiospora rasikravindrae TaxID=990691 RepID=A0ABR1SIW1_9PEZI
MQISNLLFLTSLATGALAGINCRGSSNCGGTLCKLTDILSQRYRRGLCAFVQGNFNGQITASKAGDLLQDLVNHGCNKCGSVPVDFPGSNDDGNGILTVNYVSQR